MAVVSCKEWKAKGSIAEDGQRTWTVWYKVRTNARTDGPIVAMSAQGIPGYFAPYTFGQEQDQGAFRGPLEAELLAEENSLKLWLVTATFSSRPLTKPPDANREVDPLLLPPDIGGDWASREEPIETDKDGNPILNSAGEPYDGLTDDRHSMTLTIGQNFATINIPLLDDFVGAVNTLTFWLLGPRKWMLARAPGASSSVVLAFRTTASSSSFIPTTTRGISSCATAAATICRPAVPGSVNRFDTTTRRSRPGSQATSTATEACAIPRSRSCTTRCAGRRNVISPCWAYRSAPEGVDLCPQK